MASGRTTAQERPPDLDLPESGFVPGAQGAYRDLLDSLEPDRTLDFGAWSQVTDPASGTYPRRVKIFMTFRDTNGVAHSRVGSGTLIDPLHVLTAGHVVFAQEIGAAAVHDWAEQLTVVPGYENGSSPFGTADAVLLHSWQGWTDSGDFSHDVGLVTLDRPIGALTGWWGYGYGGCGWFEEGSWHHAGWPAENPYDGELMYENYGLFDTCSSSSHKASFTSPSFGGHSGSGAEREGAVYAVISTSDRTSSTTDCMVTSAKFNDIGLWLDQDSPSSFDLIPLALQTPSQVHEVDEILPFSFVLLNYGDQSASGTWNYDVYLSTDDVITNTDLFLQHGYFDLTLAPRQFFNISLSGISVPAGTPIGSYHIGIIFDVNDGNPANNATSGQDASEIQVDCPQITPPAPVLYSPPDGSTCQVTEHLYFNWSDVGTGVAYDLSVWSDSTQFPVYSTLDNYFYLDGLAPSTTYHWSIAARYGCGPSTPYGASSTFKTAPDTSFIATVTSPADGEHCVGTSPILDWSPIRGAASYEVQVDTQCGQGTIVTGITATSLTLSSLIPGAQYFWRVRGRTTCGQTMQWSDASASCWSFQVAPASVMPPITVSPKGGSCTSPDVTLQWNHVNGWSSYEVEVNTSCGGGDTYTTSSNVVQLYNLLPGTTYYWRVRVHHECGLTSSWTPCDSFFIDDTPPVNPTAVNSNSHTPGVWSLDNTVDVWWPFGSDACSGWVEYGTLWDQQPLTVPTVPRGGWAPEIAIETSPPLPDGKSHYFHVRAIDRAGYWADGAVHIGPFWIDATAPSTPVNLKASVPLDLPGDFGQVIFTWDPCTDNLSGVAGYSIKLDASNPGPVADATVDVTTESVTLGLGDGSFAFAVRAVDAAGNAGGTTLAGDLINSRALPAFLEPWAGELLTEGDLVTVRWEGVGGTTSGGTLSLSTDRGLTFTPIATLSAAEVAAGQYSWLVPAVGSSDAVLLLHVEQLIGPLDAASAVFLLQAVTGVDDQPVTMAGTRLEPSHPNPFNPRTTIAYVLAEASEVRLEIFDAAGRRVRVLRGGTRETAGQHRIVWDGTNDRGQRVSSGVYFLRLETRSYAGTRRMVLLK